VRRKRSPAHPEIVGKKEHDRSRDRGVNKRGEEALERGGRTLLQHEDKKEKKGKTGTCLLFWSLRKIVKVSRGQRREGKEEKRGTGQG